MKIGTVIVSFSLAIVILLNSLQVTFTYAYYYLDPIDFIEKLCENRDKPELQCNGKCQLKKVVENNDSNDNQNSPIKIDFKRILLYVVKQLEYKLAAIDFKNNEGLKYNNLYAYISIYSIYHPPKL